MIKRFNDHAANERTYLAWIRTAVSIMAFGFLVEKFTLFLRYLSASMSVKNIKYQQDISVSPEIVGWILMLVAVIIIIVATFRFFAYRRAIAKEEVVTFRALIPNLLLSLMICFIAVFLLVYVGHQLYIDYQLYYNPQP